MRVAVVVPFLDEERHLPTLLRTLAAQTRRPDLLLLVDDGSRDRSGAIADEFAAAHPWAKVVHRPRRPPQRDRLATAAELLAFNDALCLLPERYDVVAKLDADLELRPSLIGTLLERFQREPRLGLAGGYLSVRLPDGTVRRPRFPPGHVHGGSKFYRRECLEQISPLPAILGWDGIDEVRARAAGWSTGTFELPDGDSIHLRPTGEYDGRMRAFRRWGACAWGAGAHPLTVLAGSAVRVRQRPYALGGLAYALGWAGAALRRAPRLEVEARAFRRREDLRNLRRALGGAR